MLCDTTIETNQARGQTGGGIVIAHDLPTGAPDATGQIAKALPTDHLDRDDHQWRKPRDVVITR